MMFSGFKLIIVISSLANVGLLYSHVNCLNESPHDKGDQNLPRDRADVDQETKDEEFPNFKKLSNAPSSTRVKSLPSNRTHSKPSLKNSDKRKSLSKNSASKSKPILNKVDNKVMALDDSRYKLSCKQKLQQETQVGKNENPSRRLVNPDIVQKASNNLINNASESGSNLINKDINEYLNTITNSVNLSQDGYNTKYLSQDTLLPKDRSKFTQKDTNEVGKSNLILPEVFAEVLQEHNNILKELLLKIINSDNITGKAAYEANARRVHLILDINNIESKNFDLELNPVLKFRDEYDQGQSNMALADDNNWAGAENVFSNVDQNTCISYQYNNAHAEVPNQTPFLKEDKPGKSGQHNVTPPNMNGVHLSTTDKISTMASTSPPSPQHNYYNRHIYPPISQLYSKPYNSYQNPLY